MGRFPDVVHIYLYLPSLTRLSFSSNLDSIFADPVVAIPTLDE